MYRTAATSALAATFLAAVPAGAAVVLDAFASGGASGGSSQPTSVTVGGFTVPDAQDRVLAVSLAGQTLGGSGDSGFTDFDVTFGGVSLMQAVQGLVVPNSINAYATAVFVLGEDQIPDGATTGDVVVSINGARVASGDDLAVGVFALSGANSSVTNTASDAGQNANGQTPFGVTLAGVSDDSFVVGAGTAERFGLTRTSPSAADAGFNQGGNADVFGVAASGTGNFDITYTTGSTSSNFFSVAGIEIAAAAPIPEPASAAAAGLLGLVALRRRR